MPCTWQRSCCDLSAHTVWREVWPGLIVYEAVCDRHLPEAQTAGFRQHEPPVRPPDGVGAT
jgi:hypothetical protein